MRYIQLVIILFCLIFTHVLLADEVYFKNNDHISGNFIELSPKTYLFATSHQAILQIKHEQIYRLLITSQVIVELNSGESLIGVAIIEKQLLLSSKTLGYLIINLSDIKTIVKSNSKVSSTKRVPSIKEKLPKITKQVSLIKEKLPIITKKESLIIQGKATKNKTPVTIGEKENNPAQIFLRSKEALLLGKGEKELNISLSYVQNLDSLNNFRERELAFPLGFNIGLTDRLEGMIDIPLIWAEQEEFVNDRFVQNSDFGIGDISAGFSYQLFTENQNKPDVIGSINVVIPTGNEPDITDFDINSPNQVALGSGFWRITTGLTLVKAFDPAALFGGISYTHSFANTFNDGVKMQLGNSFSYRFGMGFAINYQLGWFSQFLSTYQTDTKYNGIKNLGSAQEPMSLETGITYTLRRDNYIQPTLSFGLNDDATDVAVDISYVRKF
ncbi:MAG: transporter [Candidatus Marithrix sp.]